MMPLFGTMSPCQVAIIVKDVDKARKEYARFYGVEVPPIGDGGKFEVTGCEYMGQPAPTANCYMAFFELGNIQLELIQPFGGDSVWMDYLKETGGGIHHIAYQVEDIYKSIEDAKGFGMKLEQFGKYGDGSGAYAYLDARESLGCYVELLSSFKK